MVGEICLREFGVAAPTLIDVLSTIESYVAYTDDMEIVSAASNVGGVFISIIYRVIVGLGSEVGVSTTTVEVGRPMIPHTSGVQEEESLNMALELVLRIEYNQYFGKSSLMDIPVSHTAMVRVIVMVERVETEEGSKE